MQKKIIIALAAVSLLSPLFAGAVGVAVNPAELSVQASVGEQTTVRMKVSNPSSDVALFEVYPDDLTQMIRPLPSSFTLESGAEKYVTISISAPAAGQLQTLLSVVARPLSGNAFAAGSGVKVPITIIAREPGGLASVFSSLGGFSWAIIVSALLVLAWLITSRYRRASLETTHQKHE